MPFPRSGEYHVAIWAASDTKGKKSYSLGLGGVERDVRLFKNRITADYMLYDLFRWAHWSPAALLLPIILPVIAVWILFAVIILKRPKEESPSVFKMVSTTGATMVLGHVLFNIINLSWCVSVGKPSGREASLAVIMGILIPFTLDVAAIVVVFKCKPTDEATRAKCCCKEAKTCRDISRRVTVLLVGVWHLFIWHAGYIIAPCILIIAAILPPKIADYTMSLTKDKQD
jgi:hypothetical protein